MFHAATHDTGPRGTRSASGRNARPDPILDDLRDFAHDLGVPGVAAMSKEELIETLRQRYVLETLISTSGPASRLRSAHRS